MTRDEFIVALMEGGRIRVDCESGDIYSLRPREKALAEKLLRGSIDAGYIRHTFLHDGKRRNVRAHRVVWIAAHGIPDAGLMIDHKNRRGTDNRLSNLRLVDAVGNQENRRRYYGDQNPGAKLRADDVMAVLQMHAEGLSTRQIAEHVPIARSQVWNIVSGNTCWGLAGI